jgi:hypothetical protein
MLIILDDGCMLLILSKGKSDQKNFFGVGRGDSGHNKNITGRAKNTFNYTNPITNS